MAKAALKTPCNSLAWSVVNLPLDTSPAIRLSILDFKSPGGEIVLLAEALALPDCSDESISVNAEDSADWSAELILPADTSD